jgi:methyl-accepting chemotaxis protein
MLFSRKRPRYAELLAEMRDVCSRAAKGDFTARILRTNVYGELADVPAALNRLLDLTDAFIRESGKSLQFAAKGQYFRPFIKRGLLGDFGRGAETINDARLAMKGQSEESQRMATAMEKQRLELEAKARSELARLADEFEGSVLGIVSSVRDASQHLASNAATMSNEADTARSKAGSVVTAASEATNNTQAVAAAAEQLAASVAQVSQRAIECRASSKAVSEEVGRAGAAVKDLETANRKIDEVVEFIKSVAFQTNLLALNASVEAARAGEAGKGFAVVAQEVRKLAQETSDAAKTIADQISAIQRASARTANAIDAIRQQAGDLNERVGAITDSVREQSSTTTDISENIQVAAERTEVVSAEMGAISQATERTGEVAQEVQAATIQLGDAADELDQRVKDFLTGVRSR